MIISLEVQNSVSVHVLFNFINSITYINPCISLYIQKFYSTYELNLQAD